MLLSLFPSFPVTAEEEDSNIELFAAAEEIPDQKSVPLLRLEPPEDSKSTKISRQTFDYSDTVAVRRYIGSDATATIPENNIYSLSSLKLYTSAYRYCEVVYYYDTTDFSAEGKHFGFTLGMTKDIETGKNTPWSNATFYADEVLCANQWTSVVLDLETLKDRSPASFGDNTVYEHIRFRPFGDARADTLSENDVIYIKSARFLKEDPRTASPTYTVRYYENAVQALAGGENYLFSDVWTKGKYETIRSYTDSNGKAVRNWKGTSGNTLYKAGAARYCELAGDVKLYPVPYEDTICYVSAEGVFPGVAADLIHTSLTTAFYAIGDEGGIIYVSGNMVFPSEVSSSNGPVTIRGYNGTSDRVIMNSSGSLVMRDITFENITLKAQAGDERWIEAVKDITIGESCVVEKSDPYGNNKNVVTGLYFGRNDENTVGGKITLASPTGYYSMVAPVGQYSGSANYSVTGNFDCTLSGGTIENGFGGVRNGHGTATSYQTVKGDVTYRISGGTFRSLYTGNTLGGHITGNVKILIDGGTYTSDQTTKSTVVFGNSSTSFASKSSYNNIAVLFDGQKLSEKASGSGNITVSSAKDFGAVSKNSAVLILNHAEYSSALPKVTASSLTGKYRVTKGEAYPVYADEKFGGALLGYEIVGDEPYLSPYIGDRVLLRNEYGVYTLPTGDDFYDITFKNALSGRYFSVSFDSDNGSGEISSVLTEGNIPFTLPASPAQKAGCVFGGWERDGVLYRAGETCRTDKECTFRAVWLKEENAEAIFVNASLGKDAAAGIGYGAPVKTFETALSRAEQYGVSRIILTDLVSTNLSKLSFNGSLTVTAKDGETQYDGGLINTVPLHLETPVTFEYMAMGSKADCFVNTKNTDVVFGNGLTMASGTNGVYAHFGSEYVTSSRVNVTVRSLPFRTFYLGGAYMRSDRVGVAGNVIFTVGCDIPEVTVGFDGYTGNNRYGSIAGSLILNLDGGTIGSFRTTCLSSIDGAVYVIGGKTDSFPALSSLPASKVGSYLLRVGEGGEVTAAQNTDGTAKAGFIHASGNAANNLVRVINEAGIESVYPTGDIQLSPGSYNIEFFESEKIVNPSFEIADPYIGYRADEKSFSASAYTAKACWYAGNAKVARFLADVDYTLKITLTPRVYADISELTVMTVNGTETPAVRNADGSFTATVSYPSGSGTLKTAYVRYVSENGNDSGAGSVTSPYKTLGKALTVLSQVGGTVYIRGKVNAGGTYKNRKPVLITGYGDDSAELTLGYQSGLSLSGDTAFDDLLFTVGASSHINDRGHLLTFGEGVFLDGQMIHAGAYSTGKKTPSVAQSNIYLGGDTTIGTFHAGGGYLTNAADGVSGDITIAVGKDARIRSLSIGADHYLPTHTGASLGGSFLVTVNGGRINSIVGSTCPIYPSESTTYQFIFNDGASAPSIPETAAPKDKRYIILSGEGGRADHALDENGKAIPGYFDVNPDPGHYAIIRYGTYNMFSAGGRFSFPAGITVQISYVASEIRPSRFQLNLNGGSSAYGMVSIDAQGKVHFGTAPKKAETIFEGWYRDEALTELAVDGDYVGDDCVLYAKYYPLSRYLSDHDFVIKGVQVRLPSESGVTQALRFVTEIRLSALSDIKAFSDQNTSASFGYGATVLPTDKLAGRELLCDTEYVYRGKSYRSKTAPAKNLFGVQDGIQQYTLCITGITEDKYEYDYTVRPYLTYYSRSGNLVTEYGGEYVSTVYAAAFAALEEGKESETAKEYLRSEICGVIAERNGIEFIPQSVLSEINAKTETYKQNVLNSQSISTSGYSRVYYVAANGNDNNSGRSPLSPWKTIAKVNSVSLGSGDLVLFRRGDTFRGRIGKDDRHGITYSAYGSGAKPIINGSAKNYADSSLWSETGIENVWVLNDLLNNVGIIAFNHSGEIGKYDETVGKMRVSGATYDGKRFYDQNQLNGDLQFYSDLNTNKLYLYSKNGNPGSRFASIEIGASGNLLTPGKNTTVDNLHFVYGGSHGVGGGGNFAIYDANGNFTGIQGCSNLTVTNCVFAWIGGSILKGFNDGNTTRFGNAVEIYGSADGYRVENNWIYQIYDTAITHQASGTSCGNTVMQDILYKANLCEYCHWSIEFYNAPCQYNHSRITRNVSVEENIIRMGGHGWGSVLRQSSATLYNSFGLSKVAAETQNFNAKNNIFFRSTGPIFRLNDNASERNLTFDGNLYVQDYGKQLAYYCNRTYYYKNNAEELISEGENSIIKETNCKGVYYYLP